MAMAMGDAVSYDLPPGFRFHPTDLEIIESYLWQKVLDRSFKSRAMGEVDLNICEPWDLPSKAKMGEKHWYFFCRRDRKYPTGMRTNRATKAGYWKATGKDKEIFHSRGRRSLVGMKKTLVFYLGRAPKGEKTNWVMHEYRLEGTYSANLPSPLRDEWVVVRVFHKNTEDSSKQNPHPPRYDEGTTAGGSSSTNSFNCDAGEFLESTNLPPLVDSHFAHKTNWAAPSSIDAANNDFKLGMAAAPSTVLVPFPHASNYSHQQVLPSSTQLPSAQVAAGSVDAAGCSNSAVGCRKKKKKNAGALTNSDHEQASLRPPGPGYGWQQEAMVVPKLECVSEPNPAPVNGRDTGVISSSTSAAAAAAPRQEVESMMMQCDDLVSLLNSVDQFQSIDVCWEDDDDEPYLYYQNS